MLRRTSSASSPTGGVSATICSKAATCSSAATVNPSCVAVSVWRLITSAQHAPDGGAVAGDSTVIAGGSTATTRAAAPRLRSASVSTTPGRARTTLAVVWVVAPSGPRHDRNASATPALESMATTSSSTARLAPCIADPPTSCTVASVHGEANVAWIQLTPASRSGIVVVARAIVVVGPAVAVVVGAGDVLVAAVVDDTAARRARRRGRAHHHWRHGQDDGDERPRSHEPARLATGARRVPHPGISRPGGR